MFPAVWEAFVLQTTGYALPFSSGGVLRQIFHDHGMALNERRLKRLLSEYISYHHEDRTHLGLGKGRPGCRTRCGTSIQMSSYDRLGGLHRRYDRAAYSEDDSPILNI